MGKHIWYSFSPHINATLSHYYVAQNSQIELRSFDLKDGILVDIVIRLLLNLIDYFVNWDSVVRKTYLGMWYLFQTFIYIYWHLTSSSRFFRSSSVLDTFRIGLTFVNNLHHAQFLRIKWFLQFFCNTTNANLDW